MEKPTGDIFPSVSRNRDLPMRPMESFRLENYGKILIRIVGTQRLRPCSHSLSLSLFPKQIRERENIMFVGAGEGLHVESISIP